MRQAAVAAAREVSAAIASGMDLGSSSSTAAVEGVAAGAAAPPWPSEVGRAQVTLFIEKLVMAVGSLQHLSVNSVVGEVERALLPQRPPNALRPHKAWLKLHIDAAVQKRQQARARLNVNEGKGVAAAANAAIPAPAPAPALLLAPASSAPPAAAAPAAAAPEAALHAARRAVYIARQRYNKLYASEEKKLWEKRTYNEHGTPNWFKPNPSDNSRWPTLVSARMEVERLEKEEAHQREAHEAEAKQRKLLEARLEVLGTRNPDTLAVMGDLALMLWEHGKHAEAKELGHEVQAACGFYTQRTACGK